MYTGIVSATFPVVAMERRTDAATLILTFDAIHREDLRIGASVSLNGVCMTVVAVGGERVSFDASVETLRRTNLGELAVGSLVNVERSARAGAEVGGHPMSGHIDGMAEVVAMERTADNCILTVELPETYRRYVFDKGYIALNGCSLTVSELDRATGRFKVYLIPETLRQTTFDQTEVGDRLNFEVDRQTQVMVDTVYEAVRAAMSEWMPGSR